ncbi:MAG TPA: MotA/TolQ/ExbB proton channel family protein [Candidatus Saccharimonadia bacterium]|nr:MotA/TolQ/ExbB proton channel family protein [Candidatus Saccharimonadia bacterium]HSJ03669.1 MotA/TolQ/ExbB proton channel family protein [Verrucomicrobium sp.]
MTHSNKAHLCHAGMVLGVLLCFSPFIGLIGTVVGMNQAFESLGTGGVGNPADVSSAISLQLRSATIGLLLAPVGLALLVVSILLRVKLRKASANPPALPPQW